MDNPITAQKDLEDQVKAAVDAWPARKQLAALGYLYKICNVHIDDIPHEIRKAEAAEKRKAT